MNWQRVESSWKGLKQQWNKQIERQLGLWAGKRDHPKPVARRLASIEKLNDANRGDQSR